MSSLGSQCQARLPSNQRPADERSTIKSAAREANPAPRVLFLTSIV